MTMPLAFRVIENISWHTSKSEIEIYIDKINYETRPLSDEELSAVVSHDFPIRIIADFDDRAFLNHDFKDRIEYVKWTIELKAGSTIKTILDVIKKMPVYGYWECQQPILKKRERRFPMITNDEYYESPHVYEMKLSMGT